MSFFADYPVSGGGGVDSLNGLTGALTLAAGTGISISSVGSTITITNTAGAAPTSIGALDAQSPNANGLALVANVLSTQSADATHPGMINNTAQTLSGSKTFSSLLNANGGIDRSTSGTLTIGATNSTIINIGNSGATVNIQGTTIYENTPQLLVADPLITVNSGGGAGSGQNSGIEIEENSIITGYAETSSDRNSWILKAPNTAGIATITPGASGITIDQSSHNPLTIGTANGLSLAIQALSLALSSTSTTGALSSTDWNTFNNKANTTLNNLGSTAVNASIIPASNNAITLGTSVLRYSSVSATTLIGSNIQNLSASTVLDIGAQALTDAGTLILLWDTNGVTVRPSKTLTFKSPNNVNNVTFQGPANGTTNTTYILPGDGTLNQVLTTNGSGTLSWTTAGAGSVTAVSVASANGFAGSSSGGATPALTLSTSITGVLKGNGTAISAATVGTDYSVGTSALATGILKSTTSTGALSIAVAGDFPALPYASSTLTSAHILVGNVSNVATDVAMSGAITIDNAGVTTYNGTVPINKGGTGGITKAASFDALSPMTTIGDMIYGAASGTGTRLAGGNTGDLLSANTSAAPTWVTPLATASANSITLRTGTAGLIARSFSPQINPTVTAAGTTTLTNASSATQTFSGTTTQTVVMPANNTLTVGQQWWIKNRSTGVVTVNSSGSNLIKAMAANSSLMLTLKTVSLDTTAAAWDITYNVDTPVTFTAPTIQKFTSSSGTYTTPAGALYIKVKMVGAGGGGGGAGVTPGNGGTGGNTTFGSSLLVANGGVGGNADSTGDGGAGGTASLGAAVGTALSGGSGSGNPGTVANSGGGSGAASPFGGQGGGGHATGGGVPGLAAIANSGSGGGGASGTAANSGSSGGGAGGYVDAVITSPSATYSYAVGAAGTAGVAGTGGSAGGAGGSGYIIVTEYYQ